MFVADRVAQLRQQLNYHSYRYYVLDAPLITCDAGLAAQVPGSVLVG